LRRSLLIGLSIRKAGKQEKKMDLLLATGNQHKTKELRQLLGDDFAVSDLSSYPAIEMPDETGATFAENAILKAVTVSKDRHFQIGSLSPTIPGLKSTRLAVRREFTRRVMPANPRATPRTSRNCFDN